MKQLIVIVVTLYLLCKDVQADVAASGLNSVGLPDIVSLSLGLLLFIDLTDNRMGIMHAQQSRKQDNRCVCRLQHWRQPAQARSQLS